MLHHKRSVAALLMLGLLMLAGCSAASPPWALVWSPSNSSLQIHPPQDAYAASAYAQRPDGTQTQPAANIWLATGSDPQLGLALSQLDASGQYFSLGVIKVDSASNWWTLTDSISVTRPTPGGGVPASQEEGRAWTLPPGTYSSASIDVPDTPPGGSLQLWVSDHNQEFVVAHLYSTLHPLAGSIGVMLADQPGWLSTQHGFTVIALTLVKGNDRGLGTLLFASNVGVQESQHLAAQAVSDLNDLLPS